MSDLLLALYEYTCNHRLFGHLNRSEYDKLSDMEERNLDALKKGLSEAQLEALERFQDAADERQSMELEAMFQAAFSVARDIL